MAVEHVVIAAFDSAGLQREGVGAGGGLAERVRSDGVGGEAREVFFFLLVACPADQCVDAERVLDIDHHAYRGVDGGDLFDREDGVEKGSTGAAVLLRDLNAHETKLKEFLDKAGVHLLRLIHFADQRSDLFDRKPPNRIPKNLFLVPQLTQSQRACVLRHPLTSNGILRKASLAFCSGD